MLGSTSITFRRRGGSLIRTLVVGSASLSILLVCYAMYQYTQVDATMRPSASRPRLPSPEAPGARTGGVGDPATATGVPVGQGVVGPGRDVRLTIYAPEGTQPRFDIEVEDWTPRAGSIDEFLLMRPRVRMRTKSGNAVRVTADEGLIEARRKAGGSLEPRRGRLTGNVVIEYDRLTERERSEQQTSNADELNPSEIVRMTMSEIEFDIEYSRVTVPGPIDVAAVDVEFSAHDLEIRFNEAENRVESLHIARGGRIALRGDRSAGGSVLPGVDGEPVRERSVTQWIRDTLNARRLTQGNAARVAVGASPAIHSATPADLSSGGDFNGSKSSRRDETSPEFTVTQRADGAYVFRNAGTRPNRDDVPVRYFARFDRDVDVVRSHGGEQVSRLQADWLEVLRDISRTDTAGVRAPAAPASGESDPGSESTPSSGSTDDITIAWSGHLSVEALDHGHPRGGDDSRTRVTAGGQPVSLTHAEGGATCSELTYFPADQQVELIGSEAHPVRVLSLTEGMLTGTRLTTRQVGDAFTMTVAGPGTIVQAHHPASRTSPSASRALPSDGLSPITVGSDEASPSAVSTGESDMKTGTLRVAFQDQLTATGRSVTLRNWDIKALSIRETRQQQIDQATLTGAVRLVQRDVEMEADRLVIDFTNTTGVFHSARRTVERMQGEGHVNLTQGDDRMTCDRLDVVMIEDLADGPRPRTAIAQGGVAVWQGERTIRASDRMTIEFGVRERTERDAGEADAETSSGTFDREGSRSSRVVPRTLHAAGDVLVVDPADRLEVRAELLDGTFAPTGAMEAVTITGRPEQPASVRLNEMTVVGATVMLNVRDQSADVPGHGRLTIQSMKDLDGHATQEPVVIAVTWANALRYRGKENRALFEGAVHATSESSVVIDCDRLLVDFDDVTRASGASDQPVPAWYAWSRKAIPAEGAVRQISTIPLQLAWASQPNVVSAAILSDWFAENATHGLLPARKASERGGLHDRATKEPAYLLATGNAVALVTRVHPPSGAVESRARINGPKLSLNLRRDASKMLIEGPGSLLLEEYREGAVHEDRPTTNSASVSKGIGSPSRRGLLTSRGEQPSSTLIEWRHSMWYDFSIEQTRFDGNVELKYFTGAALQRVLNPSAITEPGGRSTFLSCDMLTVDFLNGSERGRAGGGSRMGQLSAGSLRQFDARGDVRLQDDAERLNLQADQVIYERPRDLLVIYGSPRRKAVIVRHEPNKLPTRIQVQRMIYDLSTGRFTIDDPELTGQ